MHVHGFVISSPSSPHLLHRYMYRLPFMCCRPHLSINDSGKANAPGRASLSSPFHLPYDMLVRLLVICRPCLSIADHVTCKCTNSCSGHSHIHSTVHLFIRPPVFCDLVSPSPITEHANAPNCVLRCSYHSSPHHLSIQTLTLMFLSCSPLHRLPKVQSTVGGRIGVRRLANFVVSSGVPLL